MMLLLHGLMLMAMAGPACPSQPGPAVLVGNDAVLISSHDRTGGHLRRYALLEGGPQRADVPDWDAGARLGPAFERQLYTASQGRLVPLDANLRPAFSQLGDTRLSQPAITAGAVFLGAADGLLHGFSLQDGRELFSFLPSLLQAVPRGTEAAAPWPVVAEMMLAGAARRILAAGIGAGQAGLFALDVSRPDALSSGLGLLWEYTDATLGPVNGAPRLVYLGEAGHQRPFVLASASSLILLALDKPPDAPWREGDTLRRWTLPGARRLSAPGVVLDADGSLRFAYVGDEHGQLWRIDLRSAASPPRPMFRASGPQGQVQPILAAPRVSVGANGSLLVLLGTAPSKGPASLYAIPDKELGPAHTLSRLELGSGWLHDVPGQILSTPSLIAGQVVAESTVAQIGCDSELHTYVFEPLMGKLRSVSKAQVARLTAVGPVLTLAGPLRWQGRGGRQLRGEQAHVLLHLNAEGQLVAAATLSQTRLARRLNWREIPDWQPPGSRP